MNNLEKEKLLFKVVIFIFIVLILFFKFYCVNFNIIKEFFKRKGNFMSFGIKLYDELYRLI